MAPEPTLPPEERLRLAIAAAWWDARGTILDHLSRLEAALNAPGGLLRGVAREDARSEAHKLVGSLGSYGSPTGSELARQAEIILRDPAGEREDELARLAQAIRVAIADLDARTPKATPSP